MLQQIGSSLHHSDNSKDKDSQCHGNDSARLSDERKTENGSILHDYNLVNQMWLVEC